MGRVKGSCDHAIVGVVSQAHSITALKGSAAVLALLGLVSAAFAQPSPSSYLPSPGPIAADQKAGALEADDLAQKIAAAREA